MDLILLNLETDQQIPLEIDDPLVIGRKQIKQCCDRRVSRYHGKIVCKPDGKISLIALHSNPCYYTRNGVPPVFKLKKSQEEILSEGDCFGLLPESYWFQIIDKAKCNEKKSVDLKKLLASNENSAGIKAEVTDDVTSFDETIMEFNDLKEVEEGSEVSCIGNESTSKINGTNNYGESSGYGTPEFEKTGRLTSLMYNKDEPLKQEENPCQQFSIKFKRKEIMEKDSLESEAEETNNLASNEEAKEKADIENDLISSPLNECIGSTSGNELDFPQDQKSPLKNFMFEDGDEKQSYESDVDVENEKFDKSKRPICLYESICYRKNPQHRLEFCHPGDTDYVPYEERPICSYGGSCYRINKIHRIEFRHPPDCMNERNRSPSESSNSPSPVSSPLPDKRRRKTVERKGVDLPEEDEDSPQDPFAVNASSDEFVPTESDADGDTDDIEASDDD